MIYIGRAVGVERVTGTNGALKNRGFPGRGLDRGAGTTRIDRELSGTKGRDLGKIDIM